jgi:formamidopyrimidine-DNA glycosylase
LTDPRSIAGIGNAYSDEILHAARLSPLQRVANLDDAEWTRLWEATTSTLATWCARLREESRGPAGGTRFPGPGEVTAFRPDFAVHGKFGKPCPVCGTAVQRIVRGDHETNYCPRCQTGGKVLADRSLSLLLKDDWPSRAEDWE